MKTPVRSPIKHLLPFTVLSISIVLSACQGGSVGESDNSAAQSNPDALEQLPADDHGPGRVVLPRTKPGDDELAALDKAQVKTAALKAEPSEKDAALIKSAASCDGNIAANDLRFGDDSTALIVRPTAALAAGKKLSLLVTVCGQQEDARLTFDATMPKHRHGMNYRPETTLLESSNEQQIYAIDNVLMHMPGDWVWQIGLRAVDKSSSYIYPIDLN